MADFNLVCVHPFHGYIKGQMITAPDEVELLLKDREHHFVRIAIPSAPAPEPEPEPAADSTVVVPAAKVKK